MAFRRTAKRAWSTIITTAMSPALALLGTQPSSAQTAPADQEETELPRIDVNESIGTAADNEGFATVSVSSVTRTGTPITSVPRSIGVVSQEVIRTQQPLTIGDAVRNVAGVSLYEQDGVQDIFIRGFSPSSSLTNGFPEPGFVNRPLSSVERLEVLKGPASILVGTEAAGGILNVILKKPSAVPIRTATVRYGSYDFAEGEIDLGGPLSREGNLTFRLTGQGTYADRNFGGYDGARKYSVAPAVGIRIGALDITTGLEFFYNRAASNPFTAVEPSFPALGFGFDDPDFATKLKAYQVAARDVIADPIYGEPGVIGNRATGTTVRSLRGYYEASLKLGTVAGIDLTLRSRGQSASSRQRSSAYSLTDVFTSGDGQVGFLSGSAAFQEFANDTWQNDVIAKFATGPIRHTVLTGIDLQRQRQRYSIGKSSFAMVDFPDVPEQPLLGGPYTLRNVNTLEQRGFLIQDQMDIADRLHVLLALRFNHYDSGQTTYLRNGGISTSAATFARKGYNVGATYDVTDWLTPYASYSVGFKPSIGGVSRGPNGTGIPLPPEKSVQYEVGTKSLLLDDRLSITLSAFDITTQNTPTPEALPANDPDIGLYSIAGAGQRSRGLEFELAGALTPDWNVLLTGAYQKVRGTQALRAAGSTYDLAISVPKYTANLWTTYDFRRGPLRGLGLGLGEYVVSEIFGGNVRIPPYALTKTSIFYSGFGKVKLTATMENVFDKEYFLPVQAYYYIPYGTPRTFLLTASTSF